MLTYFRLRYYLNMTEEEVDNTEATIIDMYLIALEEIKGKGGANQEEDEIARAFMG